MISVRLSEEEYLALKRLCLLTGARSVSELTRDSMQVLLSRASGEAIARANMEEFRAEIRNLNDKIEELAAHISISKNNNKP
jgi:hypothetical protein